MLTHSAKAPARVHLGAAERARLAAERRRRVMARADGVEPRRRRRTLTPGEIQRLVAELRTWDHARSPLRWATVIDHAQTFTGHRFSRQALETHASIKKAFQESRDGAARKAGKVPKDPAMAMMHRRVEHLVADVRRLKELLAKAEERFARWAYNAHRKGVTEKELDLELHKADRGQTAVVPAAGPEVRRRTAVRLGTTQAPAARRASRSS